MPATELLSDADLYFQTTIRTAMCLKYVLSSSKTDFQVFVLADLAGSGSQSQAPPAHGSSQGPDAMDRSGVRLATTSLNAFCVADLVPHSADTMRELHKQGGTEEDVISALQVLPVVCGTRTKYSPCS